MPDPDSPKTIKKRVAISVIAQVVSQVLMGLLGVVILKIMTNDLGAGLYGTYVTIFTFVTTFSLLTDLGVNTITAREVAKHPDNAADIIGHNMGLRIFLSLVMIPLIFGLGFIIYPHESSQLHTGIFIMSIFLIFNVVWATSGGYFAAKIRNDVTARITLLQQVLFLAGVCIVSVLGWKLYGYIAAYVSAIAIGAIVLFCMTRNHIPVRPRVNIKIWQTVLKSSITLGIISIINVLYLKADTIMLSIMSGAHAIGIYGVAFLLITVFSGLPGYIMGALTPSMATASHTELQEIVQKALHYMAFFSLLLVVGAVLVRHDVVLLVSSKDFIAAAEPFAILSLGVAFSYISNVFSSASIAIDKHHKFVYRSLMTLALNIALNLVLIPRYGIIGAACATTSSQLVGMIIGYRLFYTQTGLRLDYRVLIRPLIAGITAFAVGSVLFSQLHTGAPLLNCLLVAILASIPYFVVLYATNGLPAEIKAGIGRVLPALKIN